MAAIGMSQYLSLNPSVTRNKRILELGSGVGLLGIATSKLDVSHVTMSEFGFSGDVNGGIIESEEKRLVPSALLTNLHFNAELNSCDRERVTIRHIDWYDYLPERNGSVDNSKDGSYDLILGSDLINWEDDVEALIATLRHFMTRSRADAIISMAKDNRRCNPLFLKRLEEEFSTVDTQEYYLQHYDSHVLLLVKLTL